MHLTPEVHINKLFAEAVFGAYKKKRYGIKHCNVTYDPEFLGDLRELLKRETEMVACGKQLGCGLTRIEEKIKTL